MKYNRFEIMIVIGLVLFCFDSTPLLLIGAALVFIGGKYILDHQEEYLEEENLHENKREEHRKHQEHHAA